MSKTDQTFIGVFDSGVGGLSVLKQLIEDFPNESFVYLGDTARLPYGAKSKETIRNYVLKNIEYLNSNYSLKAVVIACNSASSVLEDLNLPVETLGVIESGVRAADMASLSKKVALWATRATVSSGAYENQALKLGTKLQIVSTACPTLVSLVEEGEDDHPLFKPAFDFYFNKSRIEEDVDCLILGCTHFPFFKKKLKTFLTEKSLNITLIDAAKEVSNQLKTLVDSKTESKAPERLILVTDQATHFENFITSKMPSDISFKVQKVDI